MLEGGAIGTTTTNSSLLNGEGQCRRNRYQQIDVQIDPEEGALLSPGSVRQYLVAHLRNSAAVNIYWGLVLKGLVRAPS